MRGNWPHERENNSTLNSLCEELEGRRESQKPDQAKTNTTTTTIQSKAANNHRIQRESAT